MAAAGLGLDQPRSVAWRLPDTLPQAQGAPWKQYGEQSATDTYRSAFEDFGQASG